MPPEKFMPKKIPAPCAGVTRRQFGKQAAWAGLSAALAVTPAGGQSDASPNSEKETAPAGDSEARYQQIIRRYGDRLSEEQRKRVRRILAYNEKLLAPIRSFRLDNGQPAATVLKFYEDKNVTSRAGAGEERRTSNREGKE
jgi:hypothetical protein